MSSSQGSAQPTAPVIPTMTGNIFPTNDGVRREVVAVNASTNTKPEFCVEVKLD